MKATKQNKFTTEGLYEAPQEIITEQATLALLEPQSSVEGSLVASITLQSVLPRFNRHLKLNTLKVVEEALANYPEKVDKIVLYVNGVDESQLPQIFSTSSF